MNAILASMLDHDRVELWRGLDTWPQEVLNVLPSDPFSYIAPPEMDRVANRLSKGHGTKTDLDDYVAFMTGRRLAGEVDEKLYRASINAAKTLYSWGDKGKPAKPRSRR